MSTNEITDDNSGGARRQHDLSKLEVDNKEDKNNNDNGDDPSSSGIASMSDSDSDNSSNNGIASCSSKGTGGARSRGTMNRNLSNASQVMELPDKGMFDKGNAEPLRRDSPYRFDMRSMRTLMSSFRGVPELQNSFRLSKHGSIRHLYDPNGSASTNNDRGENLLGARNDDDEEETEEDVDAALQFAVNWVTGKGNPPAETKISGEVTTGVSAISRQEEAQQEHSEGGIDDLVFDEATGTYVYREFEYTYPAAAVPAPASASEPQPQSVDNYDAPCERKSEQFTLEEMQAEAMGLDPHDAGGYEDENCEMEIAPGTYVPFRGAKETWQAVATETTHELECFDCGLQLVCINDCEYTVCPDCRVVNPVFCENPVGKPFGVGMGFNKAWVIKKQHLQKMRQLIEKRHE